MGRGHDSPFPDPLEDFYEEDDVAELLEDEVSADKAHDFTQESYDEYLASEVVLPHGGESARAKVITRKRDTNGNPIGKRSPSRNPVLDTGLYEVQFPDGSTEEITANLIAENIYSQVDSEGCSFSVIKEIVDHRTNGHAVAIDDGYLETNAGQRRCRQTTKGWELLCDLADQTLDWIALRDLKESMPVQVTEYAMANKLTEQPAFAWWVRDVLCRQDRIISKVKSHYWKQIHKYGVELPKLVKRALEIDKEMRTSCTTPSRRK
jgi:hypothetical protein